MTPPPESTVLDRRTLNRTLLARQHLLVRVKMDVPAMIEHLVGMQAQVPRDPYLGLWSRLQDFDPTALERLLLDRQAVRMTLMRTTLHLVTAADAVPLRSVVQSVCEQGFVSSPFRRRLDGVDVAAVCDAATTFVEERPRSLSELGSLLAERWPTADAEALAYAARYLLPLVQVPPRGLLRRSSAPRVTTLAAWLGPAAAAPMPGIAPLDDVVRRYLRAFGPATAADLRAWSWLRDARGVLQRLRPTLRTYRDERGRELFDVEDGLFASPELPAPVRFLGEYDNVFLAHADRSRITGDSAWGAAYVRRGAFFADGTLAGAWRLQADRDEARLSVEPRVPLGPTERDEVAAEARSLLDLLASDRVHRRIVDWAA